MNSKPQYRIWDILSRCYKFLPVVCLEIGVVVLRLFAVKVRGVVQPLQTLHLPEVLHPFPEHQQVCFLIHFLVYHLLHFIVFTELLFNAFHAINTLRQAFL